MYQVKKLIKPLMMGVELIHACPNHCILYRGVFKDLTKCPNCGASRYKVNEDCSEGTNTGKKRAERKMTLLRTLKRSTLAVDDTN
jgi:hypothetical protein